MAWQAKNLVLRGLTRLKPRCVRRQQAIISVPASYARPCSSRCQTAVTMSLLCRIVTRGPDRDCGRSDGGNVSDSLNVELLSRICAAPGIAGREERVREIVVDELTPLVDEIRFDALGSVIGTRRGDGPRVMVAAHMDEIGFFVSHIDDKGFIRLQPVGGFDPRVLVAQRVLI